MTKEMLEAAASARTMGFLETANAMNLFAANFCEQVAHPACVEGRLMCLASNEEHRLDTAYSGASETGSRGNGKRMLRGS